MKEPVRGDEEKLKRINTEMRRSQRSYRASYLQVTGRKASDVLRGGAAVEEEKIFRL